MGIDPVTHKPKNDTLSNGEGESKSAANLSHMAQWESARLEAEARLVRESKFRSTNTPSTSSSSSFPAPVAPWLELFRTWHGSRQTGQGCGVLNKNGQSSHMGIDMESPTSTLSFSENNTIVEELADWKCLPRPSAGGGYSLSTPLLLMNSHGGGMAMSSDNSSSWVQDVKVVKQGGGSGSLLNENFGDGLTEMVIIEKYSDEQVDSSSEEGICGDHNNNGGGISMRSLGFNCDNEDENKSYWNSLINLMNSSNNPSVSSPPLF